MYMSKPLRILIVEDSYDDTELLIRELKRGGYDPIYERVETASAMKIMLERYEWDIIISDHSMPLFSSFGALTQLHLSGLDLPFIVVSGVIGEEAAVAAMKAGAHDYIMKDNVSRLIPAIDRELKEAEERKKRKQAEEALRRSQASLTNAQRIAHMGNWEWNVVKNELYWSDEIYRIFGLVPGTFKPTHEMVLNVVHPRDRNHVKNSIHESLYGKKPYRIDFRIILPNGSVRFIHEEAEVIFNTAGKAIQMNGISQDITEQKCAEEEKVKLQEQLYHFQKLESIGTLTGSIAHDFNTTLSVIIGYVELLQYAMEKNTGSDDASLKDYIQRIHTVAENAIHLTRNLLIFSRKEINDPKPVQANTLVKCTGSLLSNLICKNIKLRITLSDKNPVVMADSSQIEQVIMNLATNARDAMPHGGTLTIRTEIAELHDTFIKSHGYGEVGRYTCISVSDTGTGMDEETKKRIFEPFFTTKKRGKGTGLGLSIVYGIVKHHDGYIDVDSKPGGGTTVKLYLPMVEPAIEEQKSEELPPRITGTETILLAEDNAEIRKIIKTVLSKSGYTVADAANGEDAVNTFMRNKDSVHLLVLDVMMAKKNGKDAYDEIKRIRPEVKVLFMSGYLKDGVNEVIIREGLPFISKPVSPTEILRKIREILDA
ncbi:MAG: response regulator [wastewater metagenome]|nr:response regulator [Candidatus Loosdrechtia aerotolerans]